LLGFSPHIGDALQKIRTIIKPIHGRMGPDFSLFSQLRLLVYPIVYNLLAPSQVLRRISSKGHYVIMIILELHKQPVFYGCFNWMIPNHYIKNGCFTKHPLKNCCLGYQDYLQNSCNLKRGSTSFLKGSYGNTLNLFGPICPPRCPRGDPPPIFLEDRYTTATQPNVLYMMGTCH